MSTQAPTENAMKTATVSRATNIIKGGETLAIIKFDGDETVYLGVPSGRNMSDFRAFILSAGDEVRYKTHPSTAIIASVEFVTKLPI